MKVGLDIIYCCYGLFSFYLLHCIVCELSNYMRWCYFKLEVRIRHKLQAESQHETTKSFYGVIVKIVGKGIKNRQDKYDDMIFPYCVLE